MMLLFPLILPRSNVGQQDIWLTHFLEEHFEYLQIYAEHATASSYHSVDPSPFKTRDLDNF